MNIVAPYNTQQQYSTIIKGLTDQYYSMLTDYRTKYIASNNNPSDSTNNYLTESINNLDKKKVELVRLQTEITTLNAKIVKDSTDSNTKIKTEKAKNTDLKNKLNALDPIKMGASILIGDYKTNYNDKNTRNWSLLIGIFVACAMITIMFRIPTTKDDMIRVKNETINKLKTDGQEVATKYNELKETGKEKAAEAERMITNIIQRTEFYKKQLLDYGQELPELAKVAVPSAAQK
jgi:hypothetical protein